jgi:glycosyltransferase involved in cell wall biosynthesis
MQQTFVDIYKAARRNKHVDAFLFNSDWPTYNKNISAENNLLKLRKKIDFLYLTSYGPDSAIVLQLPKNKYTTLWHFEECHTASMCSIAFTKFASDIAIFPYPNDMIQYVTYSHNRLLVHEPMCATMEMYSDAKKDRKYDVCLAGAISNLYPLRVHFSHFIQNKQLTGNNYQLLHPGYFHLDSKLNSTKTAFQRREYAKFLGDCKLVVVTSSVFRYALLKFPEAALSGALIIGDAPHDRSEFFKRHIVEVDREAGINELNDAVKYWLNNNEIRIQKAKILQDIAIKYLTWDQYVWRLLSIYKKYKSGVRGLDFSYPFILGCQAANRVVVNGTKLKTRYC